VNASTDVPHRFGIGFGGMASALPQAKTSGFSRRKRSGGGLIPRKANQSNKGFSPGAAEPQQVSHQPESLKEIQWQIQ
jgi:hypothetical protein